MSSILATAGRVAATSAGVLGGSLAALALAWRTAKNVREARYLRTRTATRKAPVVVITGGSSGLGAAIAVRYAARGARLVLGARGKERLEEVAGECAGVSPDREVPLVVPTDVGVEEECAALVQAALDAHGRIDILVLSAGVGAHALFEAIDDLSVLETLMRINFMGAVYATKAALPHLIAARGQIVVMSSLSGEMGLPYRAPYCASKFAVTGFFEALRMEIDEDDVQITIVCPPSVRTAFRDNLVLDAVGSHTNATTTHSSAPHRNDNKNDKGKEEEDDTRMPLDPCVDVIMDAIDHGRRKVYFPLAAYVAVYIRPFFPELVDWNAKRKAKL